MNEARIHAHFVWRVLASLIDFAVVMITSLTVSALSVPILMIATSVLHLEEPLKSNVFVLTGGALALVVSTAYFAGFECSRLQATPGKILLGLKVTDLRGERIGFIRAVLRFFLKTMSGSLFGLAYLTCLVTENRQTVHDVVVNTLVWKVRDDGNVPDGTALSANQEVEDR
jgi:uncharacterized RDD family membrane protein YckC